MRQVGEGGTFRPYLSEVVEVINYLLNNKYFNLFGSIIGLYGQSVILSTRNDTVQDFYSGIKK